MQLKLSIGVLALNLAAHQLPAACPWSRLCLVVFMDSEIAYALTEAELLSCCRGFQQLLNRDVPP